MITFLFTDCLMQPHLRQ